MLPGAPDITSQPQSITVAGTSNAVFSVTSSGAPPFAYQWRKGAVDISNATNASLTIPGALPADAGDYSVFIQNAYGTATSTPALLTVVPLIISQQPQPQVVSATSSTTFSVGVSGQGPFTYQWQLNGGDLTGANAPTLTLTNVRATNAGTYTVVVGNAFGSVVSTGAVLTIQSSPTIIQQPAGLLAGYGSSPGFTVQAGGEPPLSYQWRKNGVDLPFATQPMFSIGFARTNDAGSYTVVVTNAFGAITSAPAILSVVAPVALTITNQPVSRTVLAGTNVTFSIGVSGTGPIVYQWVRNGVALSEYGPMLSLTNVTTADAGNYQAYAYNDLGSISSALAMLTVQVPPVLITTPQPAAVGVGSNALFTGSASGVPGPGYYWLKDGVRVTNVVGYTGLATTQLLALAVSAAHAGNYFLVATNVVGAVTSPPAALTVLLPPQIFTQPQSVAVNRTNPAVEWPVQFTVVATNALSHAWFYQSGAAALPLTGQPWVTNADTATLGLPDARRTNAGGYFVVLTNLYGTTTSSVANLRVRVPALLATNASGLGLVAGGRLRLTFGDQEAGAPTAAELASLEVQYTLALQGTNTVWTRLPVVFTGTNGQWFVEDNAPGFATRRYYRVIER